MQNEMALYIPERKTEFLATKNDLLAIKNLGLIVNQNRLPEILFISSFPPRECGIASYSQDLLNALNNQFGSSFQFKTCALESNIEKHNYQKIDYVLDTDCPNSFLKTAFYINKNDNIKIVVIQHEFGFFAKKENEFINFIESISKPLVFVFHTVLPRPDEILSSKVKAMSKFASSIVVMTVNAANILINDYDVPASKISIIPHGTHLILPFDKEKLKKKYNLTNKKVLSTFGLLSSSKSIETTLDALPAVIKIHPDVIFLVIGKTHPTIVKNEGEAYRKMLEEKVVALNIEKNVRFVNEYLQLPILLEYLQLLDIYLFTSKDPYQAVSGTFSYAVSSGCAVISTPIPHAKEVLSNKNGIIIDFENSTQLANSIVLLLNNEILRSEISFNSFHKMASTAWQNSAVAHAFLFQKLVLNSFELNFKAPPVNISHIKRMTTNFGMIQFAKISEPDLFSGYALDDNARALIAICQHYEMFQNKEDLDLITTYLNFIKFCQQSTGKFLNYVNEQKEFTNQNFSENLEDSNGRAVWALGYVISLKDILPINLIVEAEKILLFVKPNLYKIHSTRSMAFIIKGLCYQNKNENFNLIKTLADRLVQMYKHEKKGGWNWFESYLTYANSLLPEALLCAYQIVQENEYKNIAIESLDFLLSKIIINGKLNVISNNGWHEKNKISKSVLGGQQPIDVAYTALALEKFHDVFENDYYSDKAIIAFNWFLGDNHLQQIVYNPCTNGCYDGLEEVNVNINQGAESTLSYLLARLSIDRINKIKKRQCQLSSQENQIIKLSRVYSINEKNASDKLIAVKN